MGRERVGEAALARFGEPLVRLADDERDVGVAVDRRAGGRPRRTRPAARRRRWRRSRGRRSETLIRTVGRCGRGSAASPRGVRTVETSRPSTLRPARSATSSRSTSSRDAGAAERHQEAALGRGGLDRVGELGEERVGDVGHDQPEHLAGPRAQRSGGNVRGVAEGLDGRSDPSGGLRGDPPRTVVDHVADDGGADAGAPGDVGPGRCPRGGRSEARGLITTDLLPRRRQWRRQSTAVDHDAEVRRSRVVLFGCLTTVRRRSMGDACGICVTRGDAVVSESNSRRAGSGISSRHGPAQGLALVQIYCCNFQRIVAAPAPISDAPLHAGSEVRRR